MATVRTWRWGLVVAGGAVALAAGAAGWPGAGTAPNSDDRPAAAGVPCIGYVDVESGVARLAPPLAGRVAAVAVRDGQAVVAGQLLAELEDDLARDRVREARAAVIEAERQLATAGEELRRHPARLGKQRAAVDAARSRCSAARHQHQRLLKLRKANLQNDDDVAAAADQVEALAAAVRAEENRLAELELIDPAHAAARARALVEMRAAQLAQAEVVLRQHRLCAPVDGTVLRVEAHRGELLTGPAGPAAVVFAPAGPRIVRAEVVQEFAGALRPGQSVTLADDGDPSATWTGRVVRIGDWYSQRRVRDNHPFQLLDERTLECIVAPESGPPLRLGQKLRLTIRVG
jgi:multidrug resistance efflux pump